MSYGISCTTDLFSDVARARGRERELEQLLEALLMDRRRRDGREFDWRRREGVELRRRKG